MGILIAILIEFLLINLVIVQLLEEHTSSTTIKIPKQYRVEEVLREELKR